MHYCVGKIFTNSKRFLTYFPLAATPDPEIFCVYGLDITIDNFWPQNILNPRLRPRVSSSEKCTKSSFFDNIYIKNVLTLESRMYSNDEIYSTLIYGFWNRSIFRTKLWPFWYFMIKLNSIKAIPTRRGCVFLHLSCAAKLIHFLSTCFWFRNDEVQGCSYFYNRNYSAILATQYNNVSYSCNQKGRVVPNAYFYTPSQVKFMI